MRISNYYSNEHYYCNNKHADVDNVGSECTLSLHIPGLQGGQLLIPGLQGEQASYT